MNRSDLTNGGTIGQQIVILDSDAHEGYKQFVYQQMKDDFALGLLAAIENCRHPVVVQISENEIPGQPTERTTTLEIRAVLTPVKYADFTMPRVTFVQPEPAPQYNTRSFVKRLKFLFSSDLKDMEV